MKIPHLFATLAFLALGTPGAFAKPGWIDDFDKGLAQAKTARKITLADFTGSDWCPLCQLLDKEVFSTPEFKNYAKANLVLVEVDFPILTELPERKQERNEALRKQYEIEGFPVVLVFNADGKKIGQLAYAEGGPAVFIKQLEAITKKDGAK